MRAPSSLTALPASSSPDSSLASPAAADLTSLRLSHTLKDQLDRFLALDYDPATPGQGGVGARDGAGQQPWPEWPDFPGDDGGDQVPVPGSGKHSSDQTLVILIPLLILLTTLLFLIFLLTLLLLRRRGRIALPTSEGDVGGPINLADDDALFRGAEGGLEGVEARWLEEQDEQAKIAYARAKAWQLSYPPNSQPSEITLSQFLSIQEKGVSAWSFEPDYEANPTVVVVQRTEITFLDSTSSDEPCSVLSNLPVPKLNETYYWECKMFELPSGTGVSIGFATRPYPSFRLPGQSPHSVAYHSQDGFISASYPFLSRSYGHALSEGDTLGVGYRPRTGTVFFTRNGRNLGDAFIGLNRFNVFPSIGATGPASVHVNLGQAGFVFIEANVKKWGLAPMMGTLAPPPAYGSERGSILLEAGIAGASSGTGEGPSHSHHLATASSSSSRRHAVRDPAAAAAAALSQPTSSASSSSNRHTRTTSSSSAQPIRPSPLRHSHARQSSTLSSTSSATITPPPATPQPRSDGSVEEEEEEEDEPHNPPTPGLLDISLHSMHRFPERLDDGDSDEEEARRAEGDEVSDDEDEEESEAEERGEERPLIRQATAQAGQAGGTSQGGADSPPPPEYNPIDPHMYAPGVAETILEDALSAFSHAPSSSSSAHPSSSSSTQPATSSGTMGLNLNPAQAALLQRFVQERAAARGAGAGGSGASSPAGRGYEQRTTTSGRGGAGNVSGGGGFWGWLSGRGGAEQAQPQGEAAV